MTLTQKEIDEIQRSLAVIRRNSKKVWKAKHYRWANNINWETFQIERILIRDTKE